MQMWSCSHSLKYFKRENVQLHAVISLKLEAKLVNILLRSFFRFMLSDVNHNLLCDAIFRHGLKLQGNKWINFVFAFSSVRNLSQTWMTQLRSHRQVEPIVLKFLCVLLGI